MFVFGDSCGSATVLCDVSPCVWRTYVGFVYIVAGRRGERGSKYKQVSVVVHHSVLWSKSLYSGSQVNTVVHESASCPSVSVVVHLTVWWSSIHSLICLNSGPQKSCTFLSAERVSWSEELRVCVCVCVWVSQQSAPDTGNKCVVFSVLLVSDLSWVIQTSVRITRFLLGKEK